MKTAYLDCFSGASGDMLLGALIDAGLDQTLLTEELSKLAVNDVTLKIIPTTLQSIRCIKVEVENRQLPELRTLPTILALIEKSPLEKQVVDRACQVFERLANAEAKVHNIPVEKVHFHEVGAIDTLFDIVGTIFGLRQLGIARLVCSPLPLGQGFVKCAHGLLPLPAPAVCELLCGIPSYGVDLRQELVTPTGAALLTSLVDSYGPLPPMTIAKIGYGAGSQQLTNGQPNLLRLIVGEEISVEEHQTVEVIETNLDDYNPEMFPYLTERLFASGALDVILIPIHMKKGRPGFTLQVISSPANTLQLKETIFRETTAIGLRFRRENRQTLQRQKVAVVTKWGEIWAKRVHTPRGIVIYPEYEECRRIADAYNIPLHEIYLQVQSAVASE